jgi:putative modified peptide
MTNKFTPEVADKLLDKLSTDDAFRDLFEKNPSSALRQVGHEPASEHAGVRGSDPAMCSNLKNGLASKEAIRAGREEMKAALTSTLSQTVFAISAD